MVPLDNNQNHDAVFSPDGLYDDGKSAHNIMVDTLADQAILSEKNYRVFSLSLKSRSAIAMAGKLGTAIWYDDTGHQFTSSKAYFDALPAWVKQFNQSFKKELAAAKPWKLFFENKNPAYAQTHDFTYAIARKKPLIEKPITAETFIMTPASNTALLELAQACLAQEFSKNQQEPFFLFLSISSTDKVFHRFGPDSLEYLDTLYHLDNELKSFINSIYKNVKPEDVLFVLSADHGGMPIIETLQQQGYTNALRIDTEQLKNSINELAQKKINISNLVVRIDTPDIYLDHSLLSGFAKKVRRKILRTIKKLVQQQPGVKKVWTFNELQKASACVDEFEKRYKQQSFAGRSGDIIFQVFPYTIVSKNKRGMSHKSPYLYDTHVPLIFYQKSVFEKKTVKNPLWLPQVATTLAQLLEVPAPSAATYSMIPLLVNLK